VGAALLVSLGRPRIAAKLEWSGIVDLRDMQQFYEEFSEMKKKSR